MFIDYVQNIQITWSAKNFPERLFGGTLDKENRQLSIHLEECDPIECISFLELSSEKISKTATPIPFVLAIALDEKNTARPYSGESINTYCKKNEGSIKDPVTRLLIKEIHFFSLLGNERLPQWIGQYTLNGQKNQHIFDKFVEKNILAASFPSNLSHKQRSILCNRRVSVISACIQKKQYPLAKEWLRIIATDFPSDHRTLLAKAIVQYAHSKTKEIRNYEKIKTLLLHILEKDPKNKESRLLYAKILYKEKLFFESYAEYTRITAYYPKCSRGFFGMGTSLEQLLIAQKQLTAIDRSEISLAYHKSLQLNKIDIKARFHLTKLDLERLHKDSFSEKARKELILRIEKNIQILRKKNSKYDLKKLQAKLSYEKKEFSRAYILFQEILKQEMRSIETHLFLANLLGVQKILGKEQQDNALKILSVVEHLANKDLDNAKEDLQLAKEIREEIQHDTPEKKSSSFFDSLKKVILKTPRSL